MSTGCTASLGLAAAVHDCDWTEPHPGHAHHNHQAGATWTGATWRDLATLRAEVEALRKKAEDGAFFFFYAEECVYDQMLDLIDKHIRASRRLVDDQRP